MNKITLRPLAEFDERPNSLVLMFECHELISPEMLAKHRWLNLHSGLLPTWRGKSANSWALLNDEPVLGFTLHEASDNFDAGKIIRTFEVKNDGISIYSELRREAIKKIEGAILSLLTGWVLGEVRSLPQSDEGPVRYCAEITSRDGVLSDFSKDSRWYVNLSRLFRERDRSDLYFNSPSGQIRLDSVEDNGVHYDGFHSRPLKMERGRLLVKTGNGAVWVSTEKPLALKTALLGSARERNV